MGLLEELDRFDVQVEFIDEAGVEAGFAVEDVSAGVAAEGIVAGAADENILSAGPAEGVVVAVAEALDALDVGTGNGARGAVDGVGDVAADGLHVDDVAVGRAVNVERAAGGGRCKAERIDGRGDKVEQRRDALEQGEIVRFLYQ